MSGSLGPFEIDCDAPPYAVVRAARGLGFVRPEDVRWCRLSHLRTVREGLWEMLNPLAWPKALSSSKGPACPCSQDLPRLDRYEFTFDSGRESAYFLGQCPRCLAIFWEES
jgi:hypothetical protein